VTGKSVAELVAASKSDLAGIPELVGSIEGEGEWESAYPLTSGDLGPSSGACVDLDLDAPVIANAQPTTPDTDTDLLSTGPGQGSRSSREGSLGDHDMVYEHHDRDLS
jgi:hypothetical protein